MKLEVGKQYKTRGGWRCVVLKKYKNAGLLVWHEEGVEGIVLQKSSGKVHFDDMSDHDIISEWQEPKTHKVCVEVYKDCFDDTNILLHQTISAAEDSKCDKMLATKIIEITEGEFDY